MSEIIRKFARALGAPEPPKPVAGYLPAPKQARFISTAEEAAKRLPANIKAQSVQNQLQKFGAKPIELEYAGLSGFLAGKDKVASQDVLAHLQQQGPLGQLKRVDQGDGGARSFEPDPPPAPHMDPEGDDGLPPDDPPLVFDGPLEFDNYTDPENWAPPPNHQIPYTPFDGQPKPALPKNFYQSDVRAPFGSDRRGSFPDTGYAAYTVPGQGGDFTGYREVLLEDPKARPIQKDSAGGDYQRSMLYDGREGLPVDAHESDYWLRYNNLPDRVAIQNIQSDIGQRSSGADKALAEANKTLSELNQRRARIQQSISEGGIGWGQSLESKLAEIDAKISEIVGKHESTHEIAYRPDGSEYFVGGLSTPSPIARDNNWKNLMLRHALLESVNQGGKPITLPTGQQMVDVEHFGQGEKGSSSDPTEKATRFNEDLANRLLKAFKEIHPKGATMTRGAVGGNTLDHQIKPLTTQVAMDQDQSFHDFLVSGLLDNRERGSSGMTMEQAEEIMGAYHHGVENEIGYTPEQVRQAELLVDGSNDTVRLINDPKWARLGGDLDPGSEYWKAMTPKERDAVMKMVQYDLLMEETGMEPMNLVGENAIKNRENKAFDPGWTIKPHPETVRAALEKGVPIMSLAPLLFQQSLLSPQQEER